MALPIGARSIRQWFLLFVLLSVVFNFTFFLSKSTKEHLLSAADEPLAQQSTTANEQLHQHQNSFNACFSVNSPEWLQGARLGNVNDSSLLDMDILPPLSQRLDSFGQDYFLQDLLDQSICSDGSRFRQFTGQQELDSTKAITDAALIKQWTMRLVYWSMHYHQTRHARREAKHRQEHERKGIDCYPPASTVGPYDYECSNAKYIAIGLSSPIGLGANVRLGMINGYLHALIADRIVIWVNDSPVGSEEFLQVPWAQVSCDDGKRARRDTQCFFMPSTPCVLTEQDLEQAYFLKKEEADSMYDHGIPPAGHENDKVWQVRLYYWNQGHTPRLAAERLRNHSYSLIEEHFTSANDQFKKLLYQAADNILTPDPPRSGHPYPAANTKAHHALAVYALRPRRDKAKQMKDLLEDLKARNSIDSEFSVGLPVRASDKCDAESDCLTFQQHIEATKLVWSKFSQAQNISLSSTAAMPSIIFTTESTAMVRDQQNFSTNNPNFPFQIASNIHDVNPDTGYITSAASTISRDASLLSAMTTLQFQLLARVTLANCCSNFHILLGDLLSAGCGAAPVNDFQCFLELEDPNFWMCCQWLVTCADDKRAALEKWNSNSSVR